MQIIENSKVKEKLYIEKLKNGLTVMIIPKKDIQKKYIIWGTHYGSNDSTFIVPGETQITEVPKGVAHFLEHKMFEQENGKNSLDVLTAIGVNANAYTTNDHTAYLFECTDNFYPALDEFMDYVQHPYFTNENVEKEKGIIGQEIMMYDDYPEWKVYLNALESMYHNNPVKSILHLHILPDFSFRLRLPASHAPHCCTLPAPDYGWNHLQLRDNHT